VHEMYSSRVVSSATCFGMPHVPFGNHKNFLKMVCVVCCNMENCVKNTFSVCKVGSAD